MAKTQTKTPRNDSRPVPIKNRQTVEDEKDVRDARRALKEARKKGSINWEQVKREVGI
jgi:hypothetical protein